jgi:diguanylate cyclase (GGDEF)-like protein/PAS domain S-box-containing protein
VINAKGEILYDSPSVERILGYRQGELVGKSIFSMFILTISSTSGYYQEGFPRAWKESFSRVRFRHRDGSWRVLESLGSHRNRSGTVIGIINSRDISEGRQMEEIVQRMAFYDTLTGLPNRNMLYDRLLNAIRTDSGEGKPMALLLMDLNHFKEINDTLGHHRGDLLLKDMGVRLKSVLFEPDIVARLIGDEFAILLPKLATAEDIKLVIQNQDVLQLPFMIENLPVAVEASIGVALYPDHGQNPDSLLQRADIAMYTAKGIGGSYVIYDTKYDEHSPRRLALIGELRQAIEKDQLFLHYQPKISFKTHSVIGVEALVRWQHRNMALCLRSIHFTAEQTD